MKLNQMKLSKLFKIALLSLAILGFSPLPSIAGVECRTTWDGNMECTSNSGGNQYKSTYKTNWDGSNTTTDYYNGQQYNTKTCRKTWDGGYSCN